jgi:arylamine N-acetyltransferase
MSDEPVALPQLPLDEKDVVRFTKMQLIEYFQVIGLPRKYIDSPFSYDASRINTKEHGLPFLHDLTRHHTCNIPFENLTLHYSADKTITLDPVRLYFKFVHQRRGGRCMENNTFFATVLRSLGFDVRNCGGRVSRAMSPYAEVRRNQSATYDGWNHMLNLVRLDDEWYVVDVGMGAMGPNLPYPLRDRFETTSIAPRKIRLQLRSIAESYAKFSSSGTGSSKMWCYDLCYDPVGSAEDKWVPVYCFTETEFLPQDYQMMSWLIDISSVSYLCFVRSRIIHDWQFMFNTVSINHVSQGIRTQSNNLAIPIQNDFSPLCEGGLDSSISSIKRLLPRLLRLLVGVIDVYGAFAIVLTVLKVCH